MASAGEVEVAPLCFSVKHAGLSLKITLDAKWQKKSLLVSVVAPFIKSFNKKRPEYDALHEDGLAGILADGATWLDPMRHAADAVPPQTAAVELHFEPRASMDGRPCRVGCGETELKIELDRKWLRQSFQNAVIGPFVTTYNKRNASPLVPAALDVAALSALSIDDGAPLTEELGALLAKPAALVLPMGTKRVDLAFGAVGSASLVAQPGAPSVVTGAGGGGAGGGAGGGVGVGLPPPTPRQLAERLAAFWPRVRTTAEALAASREAAWTNFRLGPSDGATVGAALLAASRVRCAGSWDGEGCGNLLTLSLQDNDLRCDGLIGLVDSKALSRDVMCSLRDLFLQTNRIGDRGVEALFTRANLPELKKIQLQDNSVGEAGAKAIDRALRSSTFKCRHLNLLENRFAPDGEAAEALRATSLTKYCELRLPPKPADRVPTAKEQMKALSIS
jgi:hypothetical protein